MRGTRAKTLRRYAGAITPIAMRKNNDTQVVTSTIRHTYQRLKLQYRAWRQDGSPTIT
jgi:hypothetical protein